MILATAMLDRQCGAGCVAAPMKTVALAASVALWASLPAAADVASTKTDTVSFERCVKMIDMTASDVGITPIVIVDTQILKIVRFPTDDGSLLVTCSRPDGKMALTVSR